MPRGARRARWASARISDLRAHPELRLGFSNEFLGRARRLARPARALRPAAARRARARPRPRLPRPRRAARSTSPTSTPPTPRSRATACACSTTTASFFPRYEAVLLYRARPADARAARAGAPRAAGRAHRRADDDRAERARQARPRRPRRASPPTSLARLGARRDAAAAPGRAWRARSRGAPREHLLLVGLSLLAARSLVGDAARHPRRAPAAPRAGSCWRWPGVVQTIPSLALLVLHDPAASASARRRRSSRCSSTACCRSCATPHAGLRRHPAAAARVGRGARAAARRARLRLVELPLALPVDPGRHQDRRRSSTSAPRRSARSSAPAATASRSSPASASTTSA